jgi:drug/metabolite transporter (DMT)-like permease
MSSANKSRIWQKRPLLGIMLMILGLALYPISDAFIKHLMGTYSLQQTCFLRGATRLIPLMIAVLFQGGVKQVFETQQKKLHLIRLVVSLAYTYTFMFSFSINSLTTVYTLSYTSSFFIILLGASFLKEKVSKAKWFAVFLGMIGILIALKPGVGLFEASALIVLAGTLLGALNKALMRKLTKTDHSLAIAIYPNLLMVFATLPFLIGKWHAVPLYDWALFAVIGILTAGAQYTVAQALRFAEASSLAPVDYSNFIWVLALDLIWWGSFPDISTLIGAAFIVSGNLYILYTVRAEERKKTEDKSQIEYPLSNEPSPSKES